MAREIGDLWPQASGTASLGAEMMNNAFTGEIRPFNNIHIMSGVFHGHYGSSGVIRFREGNGNQGHGFQVSFDGGNKFPLAIGYGTQDVNPAGPFLHSFEVLNIQTSGLYAALQGESSLTHLDSFIWDAIGSFTMDAGAPITLQTNFGTYANITISAEGNLDLNAGTALLNNQKGQITLAPWNGSGVLQYRFGPHQSWYIKQSHTSIGGPEGDGYFPVPHSGQILQMILENAGAPGGGSTLQAAYEANNNVFTSLTQGGPVNLAGTNTYALGLFQASADHPHMLVSGIFSLPANGLVRGSQWLQAHTAGWSAQLQGLSEPTSASVASARALGPDTWFMHAGSSGIVNARTGSGIAQFFNISASNSISEIGLNAPLSTATTPDTWFAVSTTSGIQPFVAGKYRIMYTAVLEKNQGNLTQCVETELRITDKLGNVFRLLGSNSAAVIRDSNALSLDSANGQWLGDIYEGASVFLFVRSLEAPPADNSIRLKTRATNIIMEWIGPLSAGMGTYQKVT